MEEEIKEEVVAQPVEESFVTNDDGTLTEVLIGVNGKPLVPPHLRSKGPFKDPRQDVCWEHYLKSWKAGVPNARQAALAAGYSENSAINVTNFKWFRERKNKLRRSKMMDNAERNIARILNMGLTKMKKQEDGTTEEVFDADKARIVADMSKLIVTTLGKDLGYTARTDVKVEQLPTPILQLEAMEVIDVPVVKQLENNQTE